MAGISQLTALIIATRDDIIVTSAGPHPENGKYTGWITLGPEDRCRPLFDTGPCYTSHEEAEQAVQQLVTEIRSGEAFFKQEGTTP